jgi:hypothetical protein
VPAGASPLPNLGGHAGAGRACGLAILIAPPVHFIGNTYQLGRVRSAAIPSAGGVTVAARRIPAYSPASVPTLTLVAL